MSCCSAASAQYVSEVETHLLSAFWLTPPVVVLIRRLASPVSHGEDHSSTDGAGKLNHLVDFFFSRTHPLRTCEVGDCSRLAVEREDQGQMDQFFGFGVQRSTSVNILEVCAEVLVRSEVWRAFREIRHVVQATISLDLRVAH